MSVSPPYNPEDSLWTAGYSILNVIFPTNYQGSHLLQPIADRISLPVDHINFFTAQIFALLLGPIYRIILSPPSKQANAPQRRRRILQRHILAVFVGFAMAIFCYGPSALHLLWQTTLVYFLLRSIPNKPWVIFSATVGYLGFLHLTRLRNDYLKYTIDPTGSLMISTQKLSALAFSIYDYRRLQQGKQSTNQIYLSMDQRKQMVSTNPSFLELLSFTCNFHSVLAGPLSFYNDYLDFMEGSDQLLDFDPSTMGNPFSAVLTKVSQSLVFLLIYLLLSPLFPISHVLTVNGSPSDIFAKMMYLMIAMFIVRCKYYFAWKLAEAVNNAAGLGFNGFDEHSGTQRWNLLKNVSWRGTEFGTSYKLKLECWNITTATWLRRVCFDRIRTGRTFFVHLISAIWHGFYPGYYLTFFSGALLTYTGRGFYRVIRPFFTVSSSDYKHLLKLFYDIASWFASTSAVNYCAVPFILLDFERGFYFFNRTYFFVHALCIVFCIVLPVGSSLKPTLIDAQVPDKTATNNNDDDNEDAAKAKKNL